MVCWCSLERLSFLSAIFAHVGFADILQLAWGHPHDLSLGRQLSNTLCTDGAGRCPVTGAVSSISTWLAHGSRGQVCLAEAQCCHMRD